METIHTLHHTLGYTVDLTITLTSGGSGYNFSPRVYIIFSGFLVYCSVSFTAVFIRQRCQCVDSTV